MADDIDDLLDEVENKFIVKKNAHGEDKKNRLQNKVLYPNGTQDEMSDVIDEICNISTQDEPTGGIEKSAHKSVMNSKKKCAVVLIGDMSNILGLNTPTSPRCCSNLLCLKCDFRVIHFNDFKWKKDTDYLFLRNNIPEFERLKPKLMSLKGSRAYACQCEWRNCADKKQSVDSELKWICANH